MKIQTAKDSYQIEKFRAKIEQKFQEQDKKTTAKAIEETKERIAVIRGRHGEGVEATGSLTKTNRDIKAKPFDENQHSAPISKTVKETMERLQQQTQQERSLSGRGSQKV